MCVSTAVTLRPKFRQRRRFLVPAYTMERGRRGLPEHRKRYFPLWMPCAFPRPSRCDRSSGSVGVFSFRPTRWNEVAEGCRNIANATFRCGRRVRFHGRHAATEVPAASAFSRSGLHDGTRSQRVAGTSQTLLSAVDAVCVSTAVTLRPKFRQRRRFLVPAYTTTLPIATQ